MKHKAYKFRIYPNEDQRIQIEKTFGCNRFIYNYFLDQRIKLYQENKEYTNYNKQATQLPILKEEYIWLKETDSTSLQTTTKDLDTAFKNFFEKRTKHPKFKSKKNSRKSYTTKRVGKNIEVSKNRIKLPKLGWVNGKIHRYVYGKIVSATVSKKSSGKYFVSISTEQEIKHLPKTEKMVGIDLGLNHLIITSNGEKIENPKHLNKRLRKLRKEQRRLSRKIKGSNNYHKQRIKVSKVHERISNSRSDHQHKISKNLVENQDYIFTEDLNVEGMVKNRKLSRAISDASWSKFISLVEYKSDWYGKTHHKIDRFFPSSKTCSCCGHKVEDLPLHVREWECPVCKTVHDRDINGAQNVLIKGMNDLSLSTEGHSGINACGGQVRRDNGARSHRYHAGLLRQEKDLVQDTRSPFPKFSAIAGN